MITAGTLFITLSFVELYSACAQVTKLTVAYASPAATFSPGWIAKREGLFAKYNLDVEMVLMQGPSTYMPALASGNIQVMYGGGTAISRAIGTGGFAQHQPVGTDVEVRQQEIDPLALNLDRQRRVAGEEAEFALLGAAVIVHEGVAGAEDRVARRRERHRVVKVDAGA